MDKLYVNQPGGFPLTTNILNTMQNAYNIFNSLGAISGNYTIISGCETVGDTVTDGFVYIDGEVFPFKGGVKISKVRVVEVVGLKRFKNGSAKEVLFKRFVEFGTGLNAIDWVAFKRPKNLIELNANLEKLVAELKRLTNTFNLHSHNWGDINKKPTSFPPSAHEHDWSDIKSKPDFFNLLTKGTVLVGDFSGDKKIIVNLDTTLPSKNYMVLGSLRIESNSWNAQNDQFYTIGQLTTSSFELLLREVSGGISRDLYFDYIIIER